MKILKPIRREGLEQRLLNKLLDSLNIIWTLASKDIVDSLKNKVVISMTLMLSIMVLLPKMLPLIFEQPQMTMPIYDLGDSLLAAELISDPNISVQKVPSEQELSAALCSVLYPQIGLVIPADFDQGLTETEPVEFQGFVCWGRRHQVSEAQPKFEELISQSLGRQVTIQVAGNFVYPPLDGVVSLSISTVNAVVLILMMGIFLVPSLFFEEKENKTLQALLVSPASISQVVIGKALAGSFYILVTALMMFSISWMEVIHWDMVILFVICGGFFSVAMGLVMGSFFEKQQDMVGWMTVLLVLLVGAILVKMLGVEVPELVGSLLPWVPSVAMAEACLAAFSERVFTTQVLGDLGITLVISVLLYALVIWKVRRSDR